MYQLQTNEKTSTKRICPSGSNRPGAQKKKTSDVTRSTPRLILPKSPLTEQQQQNILQLPSQRQQQGVIQLSQPWQQQNILPQLQQEVTFQNISYGQYVPEINPQLCKLPPILPEIEEGCDESALLFREDVLHDKNPQPEKTNISKQSFAKKKGNDDQDQDLDEKSGGWEKNEIKILLDYLQENFSSWSKGNKTKFYNDIAKNILVNKEANAIKGKLSRLIKKYENVKKHNNQSGVERKDWYWYDQLDAIFGTRENITPSFLANKSRSVIEEETETKRESCKKQKGKNNIEVMSMAIVEMNQSREKIWEQKMMFEKEKLEKSHELEKERILAEKEKWEYEKEKAKAEREQAKMEFELRMKELELRYQKRD